MIPKNKTGKIKNDKQDNDFKPPTAIKQIFEGKKFSRWSRDENEVYIGFLQLYQNSFIATNKLRDMNMYKKMSEHLGKSSHMKSNIQCRSHHQKMLKKYGTMQKIIS